MTRVRFAIGSLVTSIVLAACGGGDPEAAGSATSAGAGGAGAGAGGAATTSASSTATTSAGAGGAGGAGGAVGAGGSEPEDPSAALFAGASVATVEIALDDGAIGSLGADAKSYVMGDVKVTLDGQVIDLPSTGVRLKGNYGSFRTLAQKAAFLLKFNKYVDGQRLFGLEKLGLNNMVQDASMIHERLGYALYHAVDVAAPRTSYARVYVNGDLYGLYATIEQPDNSSYLERWFGDDSGTLYEGEYGSDLYTDWIGTFDQDNGEDVGLSDIYEVVYRLDHFDDPEAFLDDVAPYIDMDRFLHMAAVDIFLGNWDGYTWTRNNFFLYRLPDERFVFMPWGIDQTFSEQLDPWGGDGRIQKMCLASTACRLALRDAFLDVLGAVDGLDLPGQAAAVKALIWPDVQADPRKEYDVNAVTWSIQATLDFLAARPGVVSARLACADPYGVDEDMDGYSACLDDCDDADPSVHPGAPELCNAADDDCDGVWDNDPSCPECLTVAGPNAVAYDFCFVPRPYLEAEAQCAQNGGHLASIHSQVEHDFLTSTAFGMAFSDHWIGFNDRAAEGAFAWTDGTPVDFTFWAGGEPNDFGGNEDCAVLWIASGGPWNDADCNIPLRYVCRLP
jgi:hypothetical protein